MSEDPRPLPYPEEQPLVLGFPQTAWPRSWFLKVVTFRYYNLLSGLVALLNCVALTLYDPCQPKRSRLLSQMDAVFFMYFVVEMMMFVVGHGVTGPKGHLRSIWNKLDVAIIGFEMMTFILYAFKVDLAAVADFLRPLRVIPRIPDVREMMKTVSETLPKFIVATVLIFICHMVFSLPALHLYKDSLHNRCYLGPAAIELLRDFNMTMNPFYDSPKSPKPYLCSPDGHGQHCSGIGSFFKNNTLCPKSLSSRDRWLNSSEACVDFSHLYNVCKQGPQTPFKDGISFDNIGQSLITVFQVFMLEGWSDIMYFAMDSNSYYWSLVFFIFVSFVGGFILMYLWAVVVTTEFAKSLERAEREKGIEPTQHQRIKMLEQRLERLMRAVTPNYRCPVSCGRIAPVLRRLWRGCRRLTQSFVDSDLFEIFINLIVWLSIVIMLTEHHKQSSELTRVLYRLNISINGVFLVEMILLIMADPYHYFTNKATLLDFFITVTSTIEMVLTGDGVLALLRALRLLRLVRLINSQPYLKRQVLIMIKTLEQSKGLIIITVLFVFNFSVLGMHIFGCKFTYHQEDGPSRKNFDSLFTSMITVFQTLTLEDWNYVLYTASAATSPWCALYFVTLVILGNCLLFNILVSIVVHNFQSQETHTTATVNREQTGFMHGIKYYAHSLFHRIFRHNVVGAENDRETATSVRHCCLRILQWFKDHQDYSLYVFGPENKVRRVCQRITSSVIFGRGILFLIFLSCILLAMENPRISPKSMERIIMTYCDFVFTSLFMIEMSLKVISQGLVLNEGSYSRDPWNFLDGVLVILSSVDMMVTLADSDHNNAQKSMLGIFKVMRLLRALRPLRAIKHLSSLKLAIGTILASLKPIGNVLLVSAMVFTIYAILGVHLFKGAFYNCVDDELRDVRIPEITNESTCLAHNYRWVNRNYNFDNFLKALLALFVMYSKDGWVMIMYDGVDAVGEDIEPITDHLPWWSLYFITFIAFSLFLMDMLLGTILDKYCELRQEEAEQRELLRRQQPKRRIGERRAMPPSRLRRFIPNLDKFMLLVILVNISFLAAEHHGQPTFVDRLRDVSFYVFTGLYIVQVIFKFVALGYKRFFSNSVIVLEVVLTLTSVLHIILKYSHVNIYLDLMASFRLLIVAHAMKSKIMKVLIRTMYKTIKQILNLCLLILFVFFIYGVLTVELFGNLECTEDYPCVGLNQYVNFHTFGNALLTLYQVCTCDNWSSILVDTMRECQPDNDHCLDFLSWVAPVCLGSFVMIVLAILGNMIIANVMKGLEDSNIEIFGDTPLSAEDLTSVVVSGPSSEPDNNPDPHLEATDPLHLVPSPDPLHLVPSPDPHHLVPSPDPHHLVPSPDPHHLVPSPDPHHLVPSPDPHHLVPSPDPHHLVPSPDPHHLVPSPDLHHLVPSPDPHHLVPSPDPLHLVPSPDLHHLVPSPDPLHLVPSPDPHHLVPSPDLHHLVPSPDPHHLVPSPDPLHQASESDCDSDPSSEL